MDNTFKSIALVLGLTLVCLVIAAVANTTMTGTAWREGYISANQNYTIANQYAIKMEVANWRPYPLIYQMAEVEYRGNGGSISRMAFSLKLNEAMANNRGLLSTRTLYPFPRGFEPSISDIIKSDRKQTLRSPMLLDLELYPTMQIGWLKSDVLAADTDGYTSAIVGRGGPVVINVTLMDDRHAVDRFYAVLPPIQDLTIVQEVPLTFTRDYTDALRQSQTSKQD